MGLRVGLSNNQAYYGPQGLQAGSGPNVDPVHRLDCGKKKPKEYNNNNNNNNNK